MFQALFAVLLLFFSVTFVTAAPFSYSHPQLVQNLTKTIQTYLTTEAASGNPQALYNVAEFTFPLLQSASWLVQKNEKGTENYTLGLQLLSDLSEIYVASAQGLQLVSKYYVSMGGSYVNYTFTSPTPIWLVRSAQNNMTFEIILDSSQFVYHVAKLLNVISSIDAADRTVSMWRLASELSRIIAQGHILRWVSGFGAFETHAWGCGNSRTPVNHFTFISTKYQRKFVPGPAYCNAVTDTDMWIISAAMELLEANQLDESIVFLFPSEKKELLKYTSLGDCLIRSRISETRVGGFVFDLGLWDTHPENAYAMYKGASFPQKKPPLPVNVTWDVSHGRRFVPVFLTLDSFHLSYQKNVKRVKEGGSSSQSQFALEAAAKPTVPLSTRLANQWVHAIYNGNCSFPAFTNYLNMDGWYRVGYHGAGFGYGLGDDGCSTAVSGGYGLLAVVAHNSNEVTALTKCLWDNIVSAPSSSLQAQFRNNHYYTIWEKFTHSNSEKFWNESYEQSISHALAMLQFVSTMLVF